MAWIVRFGAIVAFLLALALVPARATDIDRHALVIANADYPAHTGLSPLEAAKVDGTELAKLLGSKDYGYMVTSAPMARKSDLLGEQGEWSKLLRKVEASSANVIYVVFYFSGHGVEVANESYILPTDVVVAPPPSDHKPEPVILDAHILSEGVKLREVFDSFSDVAKKLEAKRKTLRGIFIIDACRAPTTHGGTKSGSIDKSGLRPVMPPSGIMVLYAASGGQVAHAVLDDKDRGKGLPSVYTGEFLKLLAKDYGLSEIAQLVRWEVHSLVAEKKPALPQTPQFFDGIAAQEPYNLRGEKPKANEDAKQKLQKEHKKLTRRPAPGTEIWECPDCPHLVIVPARTYKMGAHRAKERSIYGEQPTEELKSDDEADRRLEVKINETFGIGVTEVTVRQFKAFLTNNGNQSCEASKITAAAAICHKDRNPEEPVTSVSWHDAIAYVDWLNGTRLNLKNGDAERGYYRLPTEAEWEYAARGGASGPFIADHERGLCEFGNGADIALHALTLTNLLCNDRVGRGVTQVKRYKPNGFGLYDVHGNAWEWVADCWRDALHEDMANPAEILKQIKNGNCRRVARGGSWMSRPEALRLSKRVSFPPDHSRPTIGFRVLRVLPAG